MTRFAAPLLLALMIPFDAAADLLYAPTPIDTSARVSDFGSTTGGGFRTFDNFTVGGGGTVERITWRGFWADFANPTPVPAPAPDVLSWVIAFHASAGGIPDAELSSETRAPATVTSTFLGTGTFTTTQPYNVSFFEYSVELAMPFVAAAGIEYWVSVLSISEFYNPAFVLLGATGGDDGSFQQTLGEGMSVTSQTEVARDRAITLEGRLAQAVPEPSSLALACLALAAIGRRRAGRNR